MEADCKWLFLASLDIQKRCIDEGNPWEIAKAFDGSAVVGKFLPKSQLPDVQNLNFHLLLNGQKVQEGNSKDMLFSIDQITVHQIRTTHKKRRILG